MITAKGSPALAFNLYRWNMAASAAVYEMLHLAEVVLRNAMDERIRVWNTMPDPNEPSVTRRPDWTLDPRQQLTGLLGDDLVKAQERAVKAVQQSRHPTRVVTHGDVVAQLTLGTWRYLLPSRRLHRSPTKRDLWQSSLSDAFPDAKSHAVVVDDVDTLWRLRNRVAHLEPLLRTGMIEEGAAALRRVLAYIEPSLCSWHDVQSRISPVLSKRPTT